MEYPAITEELLVLLEQRGVGIRKDAMGGCSGGLYVFKGKNCLMIDTDSPSLETTVTCARAICQVIKDLESIYLKPAIREFIDKYASDV